MKPSPNLRSFSPILHNWLSLRETLTLSPTQIATINPNTHTAPVFRSRTDAETTAKIYANAPVLIEEGKGASGNPWGLKFMAMLHMANDSRQFRTGQQLAEAGFEREGTNWVPAGLRPKQGISAVEETHADSLAHSDGASSNDRYVPLYEGKMISSYDHRYGDFENAKQKQRADYREIPRPSSDQLIDPSFEVLPRYWVSEAEVDARLSTRGWTRGWLIGWRDITNTTNERTVIATVLPRRGVNHKIPLLFSDQPLNLVVCLLGNMLALPFDFVARQKVGGTNLALFYLKQLPALPPNFYTESRLAALVPSLLELIYTSHALAPFARDLGHDGPPFAWNEERRAHLRADLDAFYARAYGLTRDRLRYVLDPADVMGPDYPSETFRVLKEREIRQFGEYRTQRLVLAAWDRMEASGEFRELGL